MEASGRSGSRAYIVVDMLSNRTPFEVLISYGTFNQATAYNRVHIWNYGMQNVMGSPIFGIGLNDWARPSWMQSVVRQFLAAAGDALRHPGLLFLALGIAASIWRITRQGDLRRRETVPHRLHGGADRADLHARHGPCVGTHLGLLHVLHRRGRLDRPNGRLVGGGGARRGARDARDPAGGEPARRAALRPRAGGRVRGGGRLARSVGARVGGRAAPPPTDRRLFDAGFDVSAFSTLFAYGEIYVFENVSGDPLLASFRVDRRDEAEAVSMVDTATSRAGADR